MTKAGIVALIQVLIVCSLGAKLLYDRKTWPQGWFKAERFDPNLPIRGRYVSLLIEVTDSRSAEEIEKKFGNEIRAGQNRITQYSVQPNLGNQENFDFGRECGSVVMRNGVPVAEFDGTSETWDCENLTFERRKSSNAVALRIITPSLFFIPDTAKDPTRLEPGEELWVLATIPRKGPPRPIALGLKKAGAKDIQPLNLD